MALTKEIFSDLMSQKMRMRSKSVESAQNGFSLTGFLSSIVIIVVAGLLILRIAPGVVEYWAIGRAVSAAKVMAKTPAELRASFNKILAAGNIDVIEGKNLEITGIGDDMQVSFAYQKKIHLVGPASLVIDYKSSTAAEISTKSDI